MADKVLVCDVCGREFEGKVGLGTHKALGHNDPWHDKERLEEKYLKEQKTTYEIAEEWECDATTIQKWLDIHGIEAVSNGPEFKDAPWTNENKMRQLFEECDMTTNEIAEELDCSTVTIRNWLDKHGIERKDSSQRPATLYKRNGYMVWNCGVNNEFVKVHRLLAVAKYGFEAAKDKDVHHKSGVRWDNRMDNIELVSQSEHTKIHHERGDIN